MKTWLLTWNPSKWTMEHDEIIDEINIIKQIGYSCGRWSVGNNKSILPGDRIFLIRLCVEPRGIVASGHSISTVFESLHWDQEKRDNDIKCRRIYLKFDKFLDSENGLVLPYNELINISSNFCWSSQTSGISIPNDIAEKLESTWALY